MSLRRNLAVLALTLATPLSLAGSGGQERQATAESQPAYIEATVTDELMVSKDVFTYVLQFKTDSGKIYTATVSSAYDVKVTHYRYIEALALAIEKGTKIRVTKKALENFSDDNIGTLQSTDIFIQRTN